MICRRVLLGSGRWRVEMPGGGILSILLRLVLRVRIRCMFVRK